jgi:glycosyltransferase involved in cell wall biosynthesis
MTREKISVIVPTRRRAHLLPRAVASVFAQTHREFELIVVDDNDADAERAATQAALAPWSGDARLRYVVNPTRRNCAAARNCGLRLATGDWATLLDDDDAYHPEKLARQLALANSRGAPLVLCGLRYHAGARTRLRQCSAERFAGAELFTRAQAAAPALFFRRDGIEFDEEFDAVEDADLFLRLVQRWALSDVGNVPAPLVEVFQQNVRLNTHTTAVLRGQRRLWWRHARNFPGTRRLLAARMWCAREFSGTGWGRPFAAVKSLWRTGGGGEIRLVANLALRRVPLVRRWVSV